MKSSGMNPAGASPKGGSVRVTLGKPSRRRCAALDVGASSPFKALMGLPRGPCCALARNALSEPIAVACRLRSTTLRRCLADRHPASRRRCCLQMRADRAPVWLGGPVRPPWMRRWCRKLGRGRPTAGRPSASGGAYGYASTKNGVRMALVLALERRAPTLGPACIGRCPTCLKLHCVQLRLQAVEASERLAL